MNNQEQPYAIGDWIVHLLYGVGQIRKLEKRLVGGEKTLCYRIHTKDSIFWLPVDNAENKRVRPLASPKRIRRALDVFQRAPRKMAKNFQSRRKRIREDSLDGDLSTDLKLIRDLNGRQHSKGLNDTEKDSLAMLTKRFLKEWSLSRGIEIKEARMRLNTFLQESWEKVEKGKGKAAA